MEKGRGPQTKLVVREKKKRDQRLLEEMRRTAHLSSNVEKERGQV